MSVATVVRDRLALGAVLGPVRDRVAQILADDSLERLPVSPVRTDGPTVVEGPVLEQHENHMVHRRSNDGNSWIGITRSHRWRPYASPKMGDLYPATRSPASEALLPSNDGRAALSGGRCDRPRARALAWLWRCPARGRSARDLRDRMRAGYGFEDRARARPGQAARRPTTPAGIERTLQLGSASHSWIPNERVGRLFVVRSRERCESE